MKQNILDIIAASYIGLNSELNIIDKYSLRFKCRSVFHVLEDSFVINY